MVSFLLSYYTRHKISWFPFARKVSQFYIFFELCHTKCFRYQSSVVDFTSLDMLISVST